MADINRMCKKSVLILGAAGMLGHKLYQRLQRNYKVWATVRSSYDSYAKYKIFKPENIIGGVDVLDFHKVVGVIADIKPDVVINCIGIIKQLKESKDPILSLQINSLLPHQLANLCRASGARFFHISTDCVFDGKKGMYTEEFPSNASDLYGRTKYLGEVDQEGCLTIRTSIIGRELNTASGLIEWFLSNRGGKVSGFQKAIYSGFTTIALADIIVNLIESNPDLSGLYQISSDKIDKYSLLNMVKDAYGLSVEIEPELHTFIDRSLDSTRFREKTGFKPISWTRMISDMAADETPYDKWH